MVENGKRLLDSAVLIDVIAEALRVSPADIVSLQVVPRDPRTAGAHALIPALRLALMERPAERGAKAPVPSAQALQIRVAKANESYQASAYDVLAAELPTLLSDLRSAADACHGDERRRVLELLVGAYHPACVLLLKYLGYPDLAYIAVNRAAEVIAGLGDQSYAALSDFFAVHVLLAAGSARQALAQAAAAANTMRPQLAGGGALTALLGELHLISATAVTRDTARSGDARGHDAASHLAEAERLAHLTGETRAWHLNFGPVNIAVHRMSLNAALGRHAAAVRAADALRPEAITAFGRRMAYHVDLGRALAHLRGREGVATRELLTAERIAPQRLREDALVRECVGFLLERSMPAHTLRDLRGLAHRVGVPH